MRRATSSTHLAYNNDAPALPIAIADAFPTPLALTEFPEQPNIMSYPILMYISQRYPEARSELIRLFFQHLLVPWLHPHGSEVPKMKAIFRCAES